MTDPVKPFRLAFREEGEYVNCYLAHPDTMSEAVLIASLRRAVADHVWPEYRALMEKWASVTCQEVFGAEPAEFIEERAPEHERSGRA